MEKDARQQEQLNQESLPVQDERESFTLEDILREFGSGSAEEAPKATENRQVTQAQPPLEKAAARMQPEQTEQPEQPEVREEPAQPPKQTMLPEEPPAVPQAPMRGWLSGLGSDSPIHRSAQREKICRSRPADQARQLPAARLRPGLSPVRPMRRLLRPA